MAGELFDHVTIVVRSGAGGNGSASFRREKYVPRGGPDGGDGGRGGHVFLVADPQMNTLLSFRYTKKFAAENGGNGSKNACYGRKGQDLDIAVPVGTLVSTEIDGNSYTLDLDRPGLRLLAVQGGKGGLGNIHFATATHQVPRIAELGEPYQELTLELELKLIADVGLVGFPNAGKSTLLSVISAARPKIAPYPFTTLQPNLGLVEVGNERFVVADIPGLIEGAHQGIGLGFDFLRHIERTRLLIHVIDAAGVDGRDPLEDFHQINAELRQYRPELAERPQIVALNKQDIPDARAALAALQMNLPVSDQHLFAISAVTGEGVPALIDQVARMLQTMPTATREPVDADEPPLTWPVPLVDPDHFDIESAPHGWRVRGRKIERLIAMTNFAQPESLDRVQRVLAASGISAALIAAGVCEGDTVYIGNAELLWSDVEMYG